MTVKDLITMMIIVSDNTATEVLYRMVGGPDVGQRADAGAGPEDDAGHDGPRRGFRPCARRRPPSSSTGRQVPVRLLDAARDGKLLEMMERGTLVDKPSSELMLRIMRGAAVPHAHPALLTGYTIPHKTGDFLPYVGDDVGVLEAPGGPSSSRSSPATTTDQASAGECGILRRNLLSVGRR